MIKTVFKCHLQNWYESNKLVFYLLTYLVSFLITISSEYICEYNIIPSAVTIARNLNVGDHIEVETVVKKTKFLLVSTTNTLPL